MQQINRLGPVKKLRNCVLNFIDSWAEAEVCDACRASTRCLQEFLSEYVGSLQYIAYFRFLHNDPVQVIVLTFVIRKMYKFA